MGFASVRRRFIVPGMHHFAHAAPARTVCGLLALALVVTLAACAPVATRPPPHRPPAPAVVRFHGSVVYRERMVPPPGATLSVSLDERTASGLRTVVEAGGLPVHMPPMPFTLTVPRSQLRTGHMYLLRARIDDAAGRPLWIQAAPAPVDVAVAGAPVTLWLVRVAAMPGRRPSNQPASTPSTTTMGPPVLMADGHQPSWSARVYGIGRTRRLRTTVGEHDPLRQSYRGVSRQRLASGVVVYTTADGFVTLTISPGTCRPHAGAPALAWRAILETPAATYRGCARGIP